ncbi:hypothetical protein IC582_012179 [Cucumis melo]
MLNLVSSAVRKAIAPLCHADKTAKSNDTHQSRKKNHHTDNPQHSETIVFL